MLATSRDNTTMKHVIEGWLKSNGSPVQNKTVTTSVNGTVYTNTTNQNGYFSLSLDLQPRGANGQPTCERATYTVQVSFSDDTTPINVTAYANTLNGIAYSACTTIQYAYKPCSNSTMLVIDPQSSGARTLLVLASHNL